MVNYSDPVLYLMTYHTIVAVLLVTFDLIFVFHARLKTLNGNTLSISTFLPPSCTVVSIQLNAGPALSAR